MQWLRRLLNYSLVIHRRPAARLFDVFPPLSVLAGNLVWIFLCILGAILFLDRNFGPGCDGCNVIGASWFQATTHIGKSDWLLVVLGLALIVLSTFHKKALLGFSIGWKFDQWHEVFLKIYFAFISIVTSGLLAIAFKNLFGRARPSTIDSDAIWVSVPFGDPYAYASFPSGHSTTIATICLVGCLYFPKFRLAFAALALWVGMSRVAVGAHFPSDVVAGFILGFVSTHMCARMFLRKRLLFKFGDDDKLVLRDRYA